MNESFEYDEPNNWSYVSDSAPNSLMELDIKDRNEVIKDNENMSFSRFSRNDQSNEEDVWLTAHSSLLSLESESSACSRCKGHPEVTDSLYLELKELSIELERLCLNLPNQKERQKEKDVLNELHYVICETVVENRDGDCGKSLYEDENLWSSEAMIEEMDEKTATLWLNEISNLILERGGIYSEVNAKYVTKVNVEKIVGIVIKFERNDRIEQAGTELLFRLSDWSELAVQFIASTNGAIDHLVKIFIDTLYGRDEFYAFYILMYIAECKDTQKILLKFEYIDQILRPIWHYITIGHRIEHKAVCSAMILVHLLDCPASQFPETISKNRIEYYLIESLYFEKGRCTITTVPQRDLSWCLDKIINGSKAQRHVCIYMVACTADANKRAYKDAGAITVLESLLSDPNRGSFVKTYAKIAIENLQKKPFLYMTQNGFQSF